MRPTPGAPLPQQAQEAGMVVLVVADPSPAVATVAGRAARTDQRGAGRARHGAMVGVHRLRGKRPGDPRRGRREQAPASSCKLPRKTSRYVPVFPKLTYEVELLPGEKLELPPSLVECVGPGHWLISVERM